MGELRESANVSFDEDDSDGNFTRQNPSGTVGPALGATGDVTPEGSLESTPAAPVLPPHLQPVHAASIEESRRLATRFTALAPSFHDSENDDYDEDIAEAELLSVALALRCTRTVADRILHDAHIAVTQLPRTLLRLDSGEYPAAWFDRILRRTRHLTPRQGSAFVDAAASLWPTTLTTEQFHQRLSPAPRSAGVPAGDPHAPDSRGAASGGAAYRPGTTESDACG